MGSASSVEVKEEFSKLPEEQQQTVAAKFEELVKDGKSEDDAVAAIRAETAKPADAEKPADGAAAPADAEKPADGAAADAEKPAQEAAAAADAAKPAESSASQLFAALVQFTAREGKFADLEEWSKGPFGGEFTKGYADKGLLAFDGLHTVEGERNTVIAFMLFASVAHLGAYKAAREALDNPETTKFKASLGGPPAVTAVPGIERLRDIVGSDAKAGERNFAGVFTFHVKEGAKDKWDDWLRNDANGAKLPTTFDGFSEGYVGFADDTHFFTITYWSTQEALTAYIQHRKSNPDPVAKELQSAPPTVTIYRNEEFVRE